MLTPPGLNINLNLGGQGIQGHNHGPQGSCGGGGHPMMRMMGRMQQMLQQMSGQGGQCCCDSQRPSFGQQMPCQQGGFNFQMGASIQGFLG